MISVKENPVIFILGNDRISYVIGVDEFGLLNNYYFGKKVDVVGALNNPRYDRGHSTNISGAKTRCDDGSQFMLEVATYGQSDYREPSFSATYPNGTRLTDFKFESYSIVDKDVSGVIPKCDGGQTLEIVVYDAVSKIRAYLDYTVYDDIDAIVRSVRYQNCSDADVVLDRAYSFNLDIPNDNYNLTRLWGAQQRERFIETEKLAHGVTTIGSKRGVSSAQLNPFVALSSANATQNAGDVFAFNLVYSGNYKINVELDELDNIRINGGVSDFDFSWKLAAGECFDTPEAVCIYSDCGFNGASQVFHDLYRNHLINKNFVRASRPIVINNWEATYFDFDNEKLFAIIDSVKDTGIDTFVLDDGWFGRRNCDTLSLGDWSVNKNKLPGGIKAIADYVHKNGIKFGLWFEPEMISKNSDLYCEHPDWMICAPDRVPCTGRDQCVLDMTRKDVVEFVKDTLARHIEEDGLDYIKWDMNRPLTENVSQQLPQHRQKEFAHRYVLGVYDVLKYITEKYPNVLIEGCAAGGSRFDAAMLRYCPQIWTSDNSDAYVRTFIQNGTSICYPLSSMDCHVSVCPNHQTGRVTPFKSRIAIASLGAMGYELDTTKLTEEQKALVKEGNGQYRNDEDLVLNGDLYRLSEFDDKEKFAQMIVSKDKKSAKIVVMIYHTIGNDKVYRIKLHGLDATKKYRIVEGDIVESGSMLINRGLILHRVLGDYATQTFHLLAD